MRFFTPVRLIVVGGLFMVLGVVFPLLMVMKILESTWFLNFLSYGLSLVGMLAGIMGTAFYTAQKRRDRYK